MVWAEIIHTFYSISKGETVNLLFKKWKRGYQVLRFLHIVCEPIHPFNHLSGRCEPARCYPFYQIDYWNLQSHFAGGEMCRCDWPW